MRSKKKKILIVDDAWINREILSDMLSDEYEILEADNGETAIEIMQFNYQTLQLVLLDMNMPGMSGEEVLKIMKERLWIERMPVICISADFTEETIKKAYDLGVVDYFARPFNAASVKRRVRNTIALYDKNEVDFQDTVGVLATFFYRIMKVNLATGNYLIFKDGEEDYNGNFDELTDIYERLDAFCWKGYIHEDDKEEYKAFCNPVWLRKQFAEGKDHLMIHYRRNVSGEFRWVSMELFKSIEYTPENQIVLLYVRDINDDYLEQMDIVMKRNTDALGMVTLNISRGVCIASAMDFEELKVLDAMESIDGYIKRISQYLVSEEDREILTRLSKEYLLQKFEEGETTLTRDIIMCFGDDARLCRIHGTIEMIRNSVSNDIEGIMYCTDNTGIYISEKINRLLYQKNFEEVSVIDTKKNMMVFDSPERFASGNYEQKAWDCKKHLNEKILNRMTKKQREDVSNQFNLDHICRNLDEEGWYSFTLMQQDEEDNECLKEYKFAYLSKEMKYVLGAVEDITEIAGKDVLTGGYNRRGFIRETNRIMKINWDRGRYAVLFFDVQNFKAVNELFGIEVGDTILKMIYKSLMTSKLKPLHIARIEADHFICLIDKDYLDYDEIQRMCEFKMTENMKTIRGVMRCGIYCLSPDETDISEALNRAGVAANYVQADYTKSYEIYNSSMKNDYIDKATLIGELKEGISKGEFMVYYQPIVDTATEKIVSAEALIRWKHAKKGFIPPSAFIPLLEENGHISELDYYVMKQVKNFLTRRKTEGKEEISISMNFSWIDFYDEKLMKWLEEELRVCENEGIKTRIEITESSCEAISQNYEHRLKKLKDAGAELLMDDFGSGYSSFSMLQDYKFDILKIDRNLIEQIETNKKTRGILETIVELAHRLDMKVVAEGVELKQQAEYLREIQCDYIQGYYYHKPMPEEEFTELLENYYNLY